MRIIHIEFMPDFIPFIIAGIKKETRRPLRIQPTDYKSPVLTFEDGTTIYESDYPCPYGNPNDILIMVPDASPIAFYGAKVVDQSIERLFDSNDFKLEGFMNPEDFFKTWDQIYGETIFASEFNPYVWKLRWQ